MILRAEGLGRSYPVPGGQLSVLAGIDLAVEPGGTLAVVGPSGSGKSTLLGLLAGLDQPTTGRVLLEGQDLAGFDDAALSAFRGRRIGFVFQSHRLLPAFTALENVRTPLDLAGAADAEARARTWLERVGLGHRLHHHPQQMSGGEQQRCAVARALVHQPAVVFADEPTGNLDRANGTAMADLLFGLARDHGTALVLVTHDAALAERCTRILRLADGRMVP